MAVRRAVFAEPPHHNLRTFVSADEPEVVDEVLRGIFYRRIDSDWVLQAFFLNLEEYLAENPAVRPPPAPARLLPTECRTDPFFLPQINLVVIDSLSSHIRPTLDSATRVLMAETIRSALSAICASGRVSVRFSPVAIPFSRVYIHPGLPSTASQVIVTTQMSLKLFGPDHRPVGWSRDAEALLVPQISERWLPTDTNTSRILLYYDQEGERCAARLDLRQK